MQPPLRILSVIILVRALLPSVAMAHESFILWHDHALHIHDHDHEDHDDGHAHAGSAGEYKMELPGDDENRWAVGAGVRYTRLSWEGEGAHLWESGIGLSYRATPWLNLGAELTYGWFDSDEGRSSGLMFPHFFADVHLPVAESWEAVVSLDLGTPGGDEGLVGDHWEIAPAVALRYDKGKWFAEAGGSLVFILGDHHDHGDGQEDDHSEEGAHEEHHSEEGEHEFHADHGDGHAHTPGDYHEVVDPHGEREVDYYATLGVRLFDARLTLEGRFSGVHVIAGETPDRNYLRAGVRSIYRLTENCSIRTEASVPISDARRNHWQTSVSLQVSF